MNTKLLKAITLFWWIALLLTVTFGGGIIFSTIFGQTGELMAGVAISLLVMCPFAFVNEKNPLLENIKTAFWIGVMFYVGILVLFMIGWFMKMALGFSAGVICTILVGFGFLAVLDLVILLIFYCTRKIFKNL